MMQGFRGGARCLSWLSDSDLFGAASATAKGTRYAII